MKWSIVEHKTSDYFFQLPLHQSAVAIMGDKDKCLDANGAKVADCVWNNETQLWTYNGHQIRSLSGVCLRLRPDKDWLLETVQCEGSDWEEFWRTAHANQFFSAKTQKCLDIGDASEGTLAMTTCADGNPRQRWYEVQPYAVSENAHSLAIEIKPSGDDQPGSGRCIGSTQLNQYGVGAELQACQQDALEQRWDFIEATGQIRNREGACLQLDPAQDWLLQMWACVPDSPRQQWSYDNETKHFVSLATSRCLDHNPFSHQSPEKLFTTACNPSNENMKWSIVEYNTLDYFFQQTLHGGRFVWSCFPGYSSDHVGEPWNEDSVGLQPLDLGLERWQTALENGGSYLLIGNGHKHAQGPRLTNLSSMSSEEVQKLRTALKLPGWSQPVDMALPLDPAGGVSSSTGPIRWALHSDRCLVPRNLRAGAELEWRECSTAPDFIVPHGLGKVQLAKKPSMCVDVAGGRTNNGTHLQLFYCGYSTFTMPEDGQGWITWGEHPEKCWQVLDSSDQLGTPAVIWDCNVHPSSYMLAPWKPSDPQPAGMSPLHGHYGFLAHFNDETSAVDIRNKVDEMWTQFGVNEIQFYDAFESYSYPPGYDGSCGGMVCRRDVAPEQWLHNHGASVHRAVVKAAIDQIAQHGGRSWFYVQSISVDRENLQTLGAGFKDVGCYIHGEETGCSFDIIVPNAAWAMRIVPAWADFVSDIGASGVHWDAIGPWNNLLPENGADYPGFLRAAYRILRRSGLQQTFNFVNGYGWDPSLMWDVGMGWRGAVIAFPYWEVWTPYFETKFQDTFFGTGQSFVMAEYPGYTSSHNTTEYDWRTNGHRVGVAPLDLGIERFKMCAANGGSYVFVGDGSRHIQDPLFSDSAPMSAAEVEKVMTQVQLPPTLPQ